MQATEEYRYTFRKLHARTKQQQKKHEINAGETSHSPDNHTLWFFTSVEIGTKKKSKFRTQKIEKQTVPLESIPRQLLFEQPHFRIFFYPFLKLPPHKAFYATEKLSYRSRDSLIWGRVIAVRKSDALCTLTWATLQWWLFVSVCDSMKSSHQTKRRLAKDDICVLKATCSVLFTDESVKNFPYF